MKQEFKADFNKTNLQLKRIDRDFISHEIQHVLHFDKGIFLTLKNLLLMPGKSIREFLFENRDKYVKPLLFLIVCSVVFSLILHLFQGNFSFFNIDSMESLKGKIRSKEIGNWTNKNIGYAQLIMGLFISFWIKIFFRKYQYNIFEILVLLSFVLGEALFILAFFLVLANLIKIPNIAVVGLMVYFIYIIWAIGQFFGEKKFINYIKSLFVYILGNLSYMAALILLGYLLKFI